jgi:hypothetical protein
MFGKELNAWLWDKCQRYESICGKYLCVYKLSNKAEDGVIALYYAELANRTWEWMMEGELHGRSY